MARFHHTNYQRRHNRNRRNVWMRQQPRTSYHAPYPPMNPPEPIIYTIPPLLMNHVPQSWLEYGLTGFSLNMNLQLEGQDIMIQLKNSSYLAQIVTEGLRIGMDNVENHPWLSMFNNQMPPPKPPHLGDSPITLEQTTMTNSYCTYRAKHATTIVPRNHTLNSNTLLAIPDSSQCKQPQQSNTTHKPNSNSGSPNPSYSSDTKQYLFTCSNTDRRGGRRVRIIDSKTSGVQHDKGTKDVGVQGKREKRYILRCSHDLREFSINIRILQSPRESTKSIQSPNPRTTVYTKWKPPDRGTFKLNVEGSSLGNPGRGGIGEVIRDWESNWIIGFNMSISHATNIYMEGLTLTQGLKIAIQQNIRRLVVETDCSALVNMLTNDNGPYQYLITDCRWMLTRAGEPQVTHVFREANGVADAMSQQDPGDQSDQQLDQLKGKFRRFVKTDSRHSVFSVEPTDSVHVQLLMKQQTFCFFEDQEHTSVLEASSSAMADMAELNCSTFSSDLYMKLLQPSLRRAHDNPGAMLVSTPFDGIVYKSWRRSVLRGLSVKNKLGFISGECRQPDPLSPQFRQWERCDNMVTSWILNSLSKEIADSVEHANDVVELWKELEDRYEQTNGARLYQIQKEINDLSQGTLEITTDYTKLKKLWEELSTLNKKNQCNCDEKQREISYDQGQGPRYNNRGKRVVSSVQGVNDENTVGKETENKAQDDGKNVNLTEE
uniref:Uncharacterized protein LOC104214726 n=1 Tax=Nicotiana sylvestris TaxID=4096 RepID=A0A1U7VK86_NICSY|nr:PREDICTED: uncharacterized protein LOC104214726 [Nicotiana sylvestris]